MTSSSISGTANAMAPSTPRTTWDDLPHDVRDAITQKTDTVHRIEPITSGLNSSFAARIDTTTGPIFLKGTRSERATAARREAQINPLVTGLSPRLRWELETSGWHLLAFDHLDGHRADYTPGSADLPLLTTTLTKLATITAPPTARNVTDRWSDAAQRAGVDPEVFAGDRLLHTDLNPHNILIVDGLAYLVDWSWPSQGAPWIDTASVALWLIAEGHTPHDAEAWALSSPTWNRVAPAEVSAFTAAQSSLWEEIADADPQPWKQRLHAAAQTWHSYRHTL
ncbi:hypothetical protein [Actinophytocola sp. NPDC049390]|uniref:hypothetical protein n=1 Tax=Actinophytocola sp. NPDC049390 TaxID=3363894 RepID=UPI0037A85B66